MLYALCLRQALNPILGLSSLGLISWRLPDAVRQLQLQFQIRLNGRPISESAFASHFWSVFDKVCAGHSDRPAYFKFLTILAFNIFWKEKVDVAIIEGKSTSISPCCVSRLRCPISSVLLPPRDLAFSLDPGPRDEENCSAKYGKGWAFSWLSIELQI